MVTAADGDDGLPRDRGVDLRTPRGAMSAKGADLLDQEARALDVRASARRRPTAL